MKKQFWQLFKYVYFFHFELLASNTIKNETGKKLKSLLEIIFLVKYSPEFLANLGHTGIS